MRLVATLSAERKKTSSAHPSLELCCTTGSVHSFTGRAKKQVCTKAEQRAIVLLCECAQVLVALNQLALRMERLAADTPGAMWTRSGVCFMYRCHHEKWRDEHKREVSSRACPSKVSNHHHHRHEGRVAHGCNQSFPIHNHGTRPLMNNSKCRWKVSSPLPQNHGSLAVSVYHRWYLYPSALVYVCHSLCEDWKHHVFPSRGIWGMAPRIQSLPGAAPAQRIC
jgi:hypothetical protein